MGTGSTGAPVRAAMGSGIPAPRAAGAWAWSRGCWGSALEAELETEQREMLTCRLLSPCLTQMPPEGKGWTSFRLSLHICCFGPTMIWTQTQGASWGHSSSFARVTLYQPPHGHTGPVRAVGRAALGPVA